MEKHSQTKGLVILLAAKTAMKEPKRSSALVRRETFASYCFLLPSLIFFLGFVIYPMILCVVTSFFDSTMNRADIFVGMANYKTLFADPIFLGALKNTFVIVIVSVPITCIFSLWVSSAIVDLPEWATSLFRCVFYLPVVTGSVAVTVVWKWMYNNYYGIFNYLGKSLGILDKNINWLGDERFALGCIILILLTTSVGQPMTITAERAKTVDFSEPYANALLGILTNKGSNVKSIEDLNQKGRKIAAKIGSTGYLFAQKHLTNATVTALPDESACVMEVSTGKADGFLYDQLTIYRNWQKNADTTNAVFIPFQDVEPWGVAVSPGRGHFTPLQCGSQRDH